MLDQIPLLLRRNSVISQSLTQQINSRERGPGNFISYFLLHCLIDKFQGNLTEERKDEKYFLGNKPKGAIVGDWRLSACTNTHKKELKTIGYNDFVDASSWPSVWLPYFP